MSILPTEIWRLIASTNIQTYCVLSQVVKGLCKIHPVGATSWEDYFTVMFVGKNGAQQWMLHGRFHRGGDQPAIIHTDGALSWYRRGFPHRDNDLPARITSTGIRMWLQDGICHRDGDKPAIIWPNGQQRWYRHGLCYRDYPPTDICQQ